MGKATEDDLYYRYRRPNDGGWLVGIGIALAMLGIGCAVFGASQPPVDDTDLSVEVRSGMGLLTDYGTGCQYLRSQGALTPRLDNQGKHICHE